MPFPKEIRNYEEAKVLLEELRKCEKYLFTRGITGKAHFRGEENEAYQLRPKITRYNHSLSELSKIELNMMDEFKGMLKENGLYKNIREGFLKYPFHEEWLLYQQAQHLGLATRFLDWTLRYEVALFFACQSLSETNGKLYIYIPQAEIFQADRRDDTYANFHPTEIKTPVFLNPSDFADEDSTSKIAQRFRARQHGRFFIPQLNLAMADLKDELTKTSLFHTVIIPAAAKANIMDEISKEGITKEWLFIEDDPSVAAFKQRIAPIITQLEQKCLD